MNLFKGTVEAYDSVRKEGVIRLDDGDDVLVDEHDWHGAKLSVGQEMIFRMIHRPLGRYALPADAINDTCAGF